MTDRQDQRSEPLQDDALTHLRNRTDELELIISSLTIFALLSLPGWLFDQFADSYTHLSTSLVIAGTVGTSLLTGVCYGLAACFVAHLMARAYWVGLIGLRTVFPEGIDWDRIPGLGPHSRRYFQDTLPELDAIIGGTDKLASSLFAVISMLTLSVLWFGALLLLVLVGTGAIGARFGLTNTAMGLGVLALLCVFVGIPLLVYLLDGLLARWRPGLADSTGFARLIRALRSVAALAYPKRLLLPVQLTLQSNTRPFVFFLALMLSISILVALGNLRTAAWSNFTISGQFTYLDNEGVRDGFLSTYYEDMASAQDRLRAWPRIDSFTQRGEHLRLFLPYHPLRDNLMLDDVCQAGPEARTAGGCLQHLWSVSLADVQIPLADFVVAERADMKMRGLLGLISLSGLAPGLHRLEVRWNPDATDAQASIDDRYTEVSVLYRIPFALSPGLERALD
ncbi:MAG: hypothetical protein AAGI15_05075 [Pseudomonadota bacterium]